MRGINNAFLLRLRKPGTDAFELSAFFPPIYDVFVSFYAYEDIDERTLWRRSC